MARYGMLRDYRFREAAEDIRGSKLYGVNDEKLGKIDDVIFDHFTGVINYIVVDTGWLTTKNRSGRPASCFGRAQGRFRRRFDQGAGGSIASV
jgi:hypothetical protein